MSNLPVRGTRGVSGGRLDRRTSQALERLGGAALQQRARDAARAELAAGRISDIGRVTDHALDVGTLVAARARMAAELEPWAAAELADIARTGLLGIRAQVVDLADPFD